MDERQTQIRERAGLEEARLNQDFIEWLQRWGPWIVGTAAVAALSYAGWTRYQQHITLKEDRAFEEFEAARGSDNPSPESLLAVAEAHSSGAVPVLARLAAADGWLDAVRRGVQPGATVNQDGTLANVEDALPEADRERLLARAAEQYQWVVDNTQAKPGQVVHTIAGLFGLAAVAESKGDNAGAQSAYERIASLAESASLPAYVKVARERIASLGTLAGLDPLPLQASVPKPLDTTPPPAPAVNAPPAAIDLGQGVEPIAPAAPAPAPAPAPASPPPERP